MPDETRETAFPDDSRNAMEESPGNTADDLSRLFADTPGKGENPVPASPRRRPGRRVLIVAACLAVPLTACGAAFFLQGDPDPGYGVSPGPAPAPRVHRKPESPAAKERAGSPAPETGKSAAEPGSLGENAKLMNELEAMRLRTRIAREEADYLKAKQAADAVRNESRPAAPAPARQDGKASRPAGRDAIISVQGAGNSLWALARTAEGRVVSLRPGSPFACGRVSAVTRQGVRVRCQNSTLFISF